VGVGVELCRFEGRARVRIRWWADYEQMMVEMVGIASIVYMGGRRVVDLEALWACLFARWFGVVDECCGDLEQGSTACHGLARFTLFLGRNS
jgi:hypothetical protein